MASFDLINYSTRVKKNIERKLLVDLLISIDRRFSLRPYRYIGMGSLWFSDFAIIHRAFGTRSMLSVEESPIGFSRASFNRPFGFIDIERGTIHGVLKRTLPKRKRPPVIAWLDHDSNLSKGIVGELLDIARHSRAGDIFFVTANAARAQLQVVLERQAEESLESYQERQRQEEKVRFETLTKNLVKIDDVKQLQAPTFPKLVGKALIEAINSGCNASGRKIVFDCLVHFVYADGAPMVTIGGIVQEAADQKLAIPELAAELPFVQGSEQVHINVPILTYREKARFDSTLIADMGCPTEEQLGFKLKKGDGDKYLEYYKYYPVFGEILL